LPRLKCTYREAIEILENHKFWLERQEGSHRQYKNANGNLVTVAPHGSLGEEIGTNVLQSIIRQSGLPKKLFRK
jgi:predicted RNA binding protein YcfA (HicA-like mRNA interferase family)